MKRLLKVLAFLCCYLFMLQATAQVDRGGTPYSFSHYALRSSQLPVETVDVPNMQLIKAQDELDVINERPYRVGLELPVTISFQHSGQRRVMPDGMLVWQVSVESANAEGIGLTYSKLVLPEGGRIFIYSPDHSQLIGAFTRDEVTGETGFATRPIAGKSCILEYNGPAAQGNPTIEIETVSYIYRNFYDITSGNASEPCEVDINCPEGEKWQNQKQGVVKILTTASGNRYYCTGSLLNNTNHDFKPYLLTAGHCFMNLATNKSASTADMAKWIFYFNFEAAYCGDKLIPVEHTLVGAKKIAMSDNNANTQSDFLLLQLSATIPSSYNPYYCGWDVTNTAPLSGVSIHHPAGDVKKISTYLQSPTTTAFEGSGLTHWAVVWAKTIEGYGVTEPGSSGAPLFSQDGLIIGTLTGGGSYCSTPLKPDYFGKMSYHWSLNGTRDTLQLKPWLDPVVAGATRLNGTFNSSKVLASFTAETTVVPIGGSTNFYDLSGGMPVSWHWYFEKGEPKESFEQNPAHIRYDQIGKHNITLVAKNAVSSDSLVIKKYIWVKPVVTPNPTSDGKITILTNINAEGDVLIDVFNALGKQISHFTSNGTNIQEYKLQLPPNGNFFIVRVKQDGEEFVYKVISLK